MKRRGVLATVAAAVGVAVTGVTTWLFTHGGNENENERDAQPTSESDQTRTDENTDKDREAPQAGEEDDREQDQENEQEQEYPEASNPEPDPEIEPTDPEDVIDESEATEAPTSENITISDTSLATTPEGATVTGTVTNDTDTALTIDLEVQFLANGEQLGRPALGGTTGLAPGDAWEFSISAWGSEFSEATDYEIVPNVRAAG